MPSAFVTVRLTTRKSSTTKPASCTRERSRPIRCGSVTKFACEEGRAGLQGGRLRPRPVSPSRNPRRRRSACHPAGVPVRLGQQGSRVDDMGKHGVVDRGVDGPILKGQLGAVGRLEALVAESRRQAAGGDREAPATARTRECGSAPTAQPCAGSPLRCRNRPRWRGRCRARAGGPDSPRPTGS